MAAQESAIDPKLDPDNSANNQSSFTYNAERVIGNGSFGIVYQARVVETGEVVAIKKVFQDKRYNFYDFSRFQHVCTIGFYKNWDKVWYFFRN